MLRLALLALDLGGTNMRAAIVGERGDILERRTARTPHDDPDPGGLVDLARAVLAGDTVAGAVVGVPGRVDHRKGRLEHAPNLPPTWAAHLHESWLGARLGVPVSLGNDADLAAVGEAYFGAGRGYPDLVYVTISTGIGAGVVLGGRLVHGDRSLAEVGHTTIDVEALAEGRPATLEDLASGTALDEAAADNGIEGGGERVSELVRQGDPVALRLWRTVTRNAGAGIVNLAYLFTPRLIVVGGGLGLAGDLLLDPLREWLDALGPPGLPDPIELVAAELGDDAGLAGAAAWHRAVSAG